MNMTSKQIRQSFLDFFAKKNHRIVESAPVVPYNDPTLLFINAGMNQFKDVFLGEGKRDYKRAVDTQKCIRVSGKHNDLEEVGVDTYHHTLFEMLGNWSFGDYYKEEAIAWAWELLTEVWKLDKTRLYATVYRTDDEAFEIWNKYLPIDHIQRFDEKDNFWEMGATGPCGPCSEIHYDRTSDKSGAALVNAGSPEVIEIWNLVFIQFNRKADGSLEPLANKFVDTGMGFERICSILQNVKSNYDTDIFTPLLHKIEELSNKQYSINEKDDIAMRVIADHTRTLSFAIADGALPSNEGRGYVLRRILRRASRYARNLGFSEPMIYKLVPTLIDTMGEYFTELKKNQKLIEQVIMGEEESFLQTMERGINLLDIKIQDIKQSNGQVLKGQDAFLLYDTFGFPLDLTELIARENGIDVDIDGFNEKMNEQKERSRSAREETSQEIFLPDTDAKTEFVGYNKTSIEAKALFVKDNLIVLDKTPFYAEMGGQISDRGIIKIQKTKYNVVDVKKHGDAIFHILDREIEFEITKEKITAIIDVEYRQSISRNHTATHLLHEALRQVCGEQLHQAGSIVTNEKLRFDFNHFEKIDETKITEIEKIVNAQIIKGLPVKTTEMPIEEAKNNPNIKMFFGDKYGDVVRSVAVGSNKSQFCNELCGGTHVNNTNEICLFKITSELSIAAGVRRIEAITGEAAINYTYEQENKIRTLNAEIADLKAQIKSIEKSIEKAKKEQRTSELPNINEVKSINGIRILVKQVSVENLDQLRTLAEKTRDMLNKNGITLLAALVEDKVQLACAVTDDLTKTHPAGKLVGEAAKIIGGGGGGRPHLATAGGKDINKLSELLDTTFYEIVKK